MSVSSIDLNKEVRIAVMYVNSVQEVLWRPCTRTFRCILTRLVNAWKLSAQVSKFAKNTATTFAPRASGKSNPAYKGDLLAESHCNIF